MQQSKTWETLSMHLKYNRRFYLIVILLFICLFSFQTEGQVPSHPSNYVTDLAGIVDDNTEARLDGLLRELELKTTAQIMVLTIDSLEGASLEDFSIDIAHNKWKIGQKGKDNGVLLLVVYKDRKYRIEVGYGLEGVLPDSLVGSIGRQYLVPNFRKGDYSRGIYQAVMAMIVPISRHYNVQITGMPSPITRIPEKNKPPTAFNSILSVLFLIGFIILLIRHPRLLLFLFLMGAMGGRGGGASWGGSSGGFGGGGGGGFGGGGASGGW
jgi:uncharacterized protein